MTGAAEGDLGSPFVHLAAGRLRDVPAGGRWLTSAERRGLSVRRLEKHRNDFRVGRWNVKRAVMGYVGALGRRVEPSEIEIVAASDGAPEVVLRGPESVSPPTVSISHSRDMGFASAAAGNLSLGCDLEAIAPRSDRFIRDYLVLEEREAVLAVEGPARALRANLAWSAKEATLKALREGLRLDTRTCEVDLRAALSGLPPGVDPPVAWRRIDVRGPAGHSFQGWWKAAQGFVWTVVADRPVRVGAME